MNKNVRLNQKALGKVVDDLVLAGIVKFTVVKDEKGGCVSRRITLTMRGSDMIAKYAEALSSIRNPTKRKIRVLSELVTLQALDYLNQTGRISD